MTLLVPLMSSLPRHPLVAVIVAICLVVVGFAAAAFFESRAPEVR